MNGPQLVGSLYTLSQLLLRASAATRQDPFIFMATNDTLHLVPYDRAYLVSFEKQKPTIVGISGQIQVNELAPLVQQVQDAIASFSDATKPTAVEANNVPQESHAAVYWLPIFYDKELILGLWLEQWNQPSFAFPLEGVERLLVEFLAPAYGIAWHRVHGRLSPSFLWAKHRRKSIAALALACLLLFVIPVPLRIVAPCEVIAADPYIVRAPVEGVISEVVVLPGTQVAQGAPLVRYDRLAQESALKAAENQYLAKKLEVERAAVLGIKDPQKQGDLGVLQAQMLKEQANLKYVAGEVQKLTILSPVHGVVIIDSPDEWRGRPVRIGEKILTVGDPSKTKIQIWIPESDNVLINLQMPIKIVLNVSPMTSYAAKIDYIANETTIAQHEIPSYLAKAEWVDKPPEGVKLGLRGSAVIYGESVSLFYYIVRKPWYALRTFLGL